MRERKRQVIKVFLVAAFCAGLGITVYPLVSNYFYEADNAEAVVRYEGLNENDKDAQRLEDLRSAAQMYNEALSDGEIKGISFIDDTSASSQEGGEEEASSSGSAEGQNGTDGAKALQNYFSLLQQDPDGVMATIEIPAIDVDLPIYWGTSMATLSRGVGYLEGTSLPAGGPSTHSALTAHAGMASKKLFTDIDKLQLGDTFTIHAVGVPATYLIDQILVIEPHDVSALDIEEGKDYVTLVTCTPYGLNTHRLLVRGERIDEASVAELNSDQAMLSLETIIPEEQWVHDYLVAFAAGAAVLVPVVSSVAIVRWVRSRKQNEKLGE